MTARKGKTSSKSDFFQPRASHSLSGVEAVAGSHGTVTEEGMAGLEGRLTALLQGLHSKVDLVDKKVTALESRFELLSGRMQEVENDVQTLRGEVGGMDTELQRLVKECGESAKFKGKVAASFLQVEEKLNILEDNARAATLRVLGLPRECGEGDLRSYMESFVESKVLTGTADPKVQISKAIRLPARRHAEDGTIGGTVLLTLRDSRHREDILKAAAMKGRIEEGGHRVLFFPDLCQGTMHKRWQLLEIRKKLVARGVQASLLQPAKLRVLSEGKRFVFSRPEAAQAFLDALPRSVEEQNQAATND